MASKKLRRTGLSQELCDQLNRHQIVTCQDFLSLSPMELMKMTGKSYPKVRELLHVVSRACAPKMQTAYGMKMERTSDPSPAFLPTTLSSLDEALRGGLACGSLTEVTGPAGCGKTQFCMMMSVLATLPTHLGGLEGTVVYIDTESAFSAERLVEIAESRFPRYFNTEEKLLSMSSKIHLFRELTCDEVLKRIESLEEEIISKRVKLVIIDSIASVVRKEFDTQLRGNLRERSNFLAREASLLKYLAEEFSIPSKLREAGDLVSQFVSRSWLLCQEYPIFANNWLFRLKFCTSIQDYSQSLAEIVRFLGHDFFTQSLQITGCSF
ncbi:DNA repair protein RAD51 homolog 2 [Tachyglossus aculeatus]|uniref:DNA repair protein RAD51 homolog 2 n=1 Tax=Tachyglossus aculeatus TaxID=9261 RepID=UPI0018F2B338|nr:DNA repair protein RAD51 homolog 2 [Tachyglossus aculeatus]